MANIYFIAEEVVDCRTQLTVERFYDYVGFVIKSTHEIHGSNIICLN